MQMLENLPLVSIITVSYNSVKTIEDTILSVINQSYSNVEYIIVDGGSTDGTINVIKKYSNYITYWISEPDNGIYDAMNKGLKMAKGDIIGIINSDDWYNKEILTTIVNIFTNAPNSVIHGNLNYIFPDRSILYKPILNREDFYKRTFLMHPTMFVPKSIYNKIGLFNTKYKIAADFDLMLRIVKYNIPLKYLDITIANMRHGGESSTHLLKAFSEVKNIAINHHFPKFKVYKIYLTNIYSYYKKNLTSLKNR